MIIAKSQLHTWLSSAKRAASLAGSFLSKRSPSSTHVNSSEGKDIKLAADVFAEEIIIEYLEANSPFSILSEEKGLIPREDKETVWIVDPLDGTMNYYKNIPLCCVSIGLWHKNEPLLGVIHDFNNQDEYTGIVGEGAWKNDERINVSTTKLKQDGILLMGFPNHTNFSSPILQNFIESIQTYKKVRLLGSAALSIAYVACGKADIYCEKGIMFWDVAGGIPIVLGAGGDMKIEKTSKPDCINVHVTNALINK